MNLKLTRPICFFDLETTGVQVGADRIVEIAIIKVSPDGSREVKSMRINPEIPIPKESTVFHGITDADIKDAPTFREAGHEIAQFIDTADLAGYNSNKFDVPMLVEEFMRCEIPFEMKGRRLVDVQNVFHKMEPRTLEAAYRFYCKKDLTDAHQAEADVTATLEVLEAQLDRYSDLKADVDYLQEFTSINNNVDLAGRVVYNEKKEEVFNFGKHKGKRVADVFNAEPSYYDWMMKGNFPMQTKHVITGIRLRSKQTVTNS